MLRYKVYLPENSRFHSKKSILARFFAKQGRLKLQNANKPIPISSGAFTKGSAPKIKLYTIKTFDNDKH